MAHPAPRPRLEGAPVHDGGLQFVCPGVAEYRAVAGVEIRRVLEDANRRHRRVKAAAARVEYRIAGIQRAPEVGAVGALIPFGHPGPADDAGAAPAGNRSPRLVS